MREVQKLGFRGLSLRLKLLFLLAPLLVLLYIPFFVWSLGRIQMGTRWVEHTRDLLLDLQRLETLVARVEIAKQQFLFLGGEDRLIPFREAVADVQRGLTVLDRSVSDNPEQERSLAQLRMTLDHDLQDAERLVEIRRRQGAGTARSVLHARRNPALSPSFLADLETVRRSEYELLAARQESLQRHRMVLLSSVVFVSLSILGLLSLVFASWRREQRHRFDSSRRLEDRDFQMRFIASNAPVIFWAIDREGRYTMIQGKGLEPWGVRPEEIVGRHYDALNPGEENYIRAVGKALEGSVFRGDLLLGNRWYEAVIMPFENGSNGAVGLLVDNTEIRLREQEAAQANEAKGRFLTNMSHEIRTPLGLIHGFTEIALSAETPSEDRSWYLGKVKHHAETLSSLLDDVLDLSKIESGRLQLHPTDIDLTSFLGEVEESFLPKARAKGLTFHVVRGEALPSRAWVDAARLRQILLNLLGNAFKFTESGSVTLRVDVESVAPPMMDLVCTIEDTGIGIDPQYQPFLFRPFSQADSSTSRQHGGAGLGLVLSRRLIRAMGGGLELVSSEPGRGSTFVFRVRIEALPDKAVESRREGPGGMTRSTRLSNLRILVVDDAPDNRRLVEVYLKAQGALVDAVEDGESSLSIAMTGEYDVILMDIQMPGIDGFEATRRLRDRGFCGPILALTAHAMSEERRTALGSGFNDYLTKPIKFDLLINRIEQAAREENTGPRISTGDGAPTPS